MFLMLIAQKALIRMEAVMSLDNLLKTIAKPCRLIRQLGERGWLNWMSDELYISMVYKCSMGVKPNLRNPVKYSEKVQWAKLNDRKEIYHKYVDKYDVRKIVGERIGEEYLIEVYDVLDRVEDIDWDALPDKFVIKCTHGSNANVICTNKKRLNREHEAKKLRKWMKREWFWYGREWSYKGVEHRLLIEKFISDTDTTPDDYKVFCCNGKPVLIEVHTDRFENHSFKLYDTNWNSLDIVKGYNNMEDEREKPDCLTEMISLSEELARDTYISRIDWFYVSGRLYFGEITMYPASGFFKRDNEDIDIQLGGYIDINQ